MQPIRTGAVARCLEPPAGRRHHVHVAAAAEHAVHGLGNLGVPPGTQFAN